MQKQNKVEIDAWKKPFMGWRFRLEELSNFHFRLTGEDEYGRSVSREGGEPDKLFDDCKQDIVEIMARVPSSK